MTKKERKAAEAAKLQASATVQPIESNEVSSNEVSADVETIPETVNADAVVTSNEVLAEAQPEAEQSGETPAQSETDATIDAFNNGVSSAAKVEAKPAKMTWQEKRDAALKLVLGTPDYELVTLLRAEALMERLYNSISKTESKARLWARCSVKRIAERRKQAVSAIIASV